MKHNIKCIIMIFLFATLSASAFSIEESVPPMKLKPCPDSPNCISSQSNSVSHQVSPLPYRSSAEEAMQHIKKVILAFPRTTLIEEKEHYLHAEFKTLIFRFVDDVEIVIDDAEKVIHLRSASRVGHSDFGVNRRRIEEIKAMFLQQFN